MRITALSTRERSNRYRCGGLSAPALILLLEDEPTLGGALRYIYVAMRGLGNEATVEAGLRYPEHFRTPTGQRQKIKRSTLGLRMLP